MKNIATITFYCLFLALPHISWHPLEKNAAVASSREPQAISIKLYSAKDEISSLYDLLDLRQMGLSQSVFETAYKGYRLLVKKKIIKKDEYLTICDFSQSSNKKRLYLLDMSNNEVLVNTYVAHGRNSGGEYATRFSNKPSSMQSSLGFYITQTTYYGEHGLSLRVRGLEAGFNDKAGRRRIVVHGADYIGDTWLERNNYMGRSYGCPAIPRNESEDLIKTIKNGSCLFIYYPSKKYLKGSKILNG